MYMHTPNLKFFLKAAENIAQLYRDDRKKNIFYTSGCDITTQYNNKNSSFLSGFESCLEFEG